MIHDPQHIKATKCITPVSILQSWKVQDYHNVFHQHI